MRSLARAVEGPSPSSSRRRDAPRHARGTIGRVRRTAAGLRRLQVVRGLHVHVLRSCPVGAQRPTGELRPRVLRGGAGAGAQHPVRDATAYFLHGQPRLTQCLIQHAVPVPREGETPIPAWAAYCERGRMHQGALHSLNADYQRLCRRPGAFRTTWARMRGSRIGPLQGEAPEFGSGQRGAAEGGGDGTGRRGRPERSTPKRGASERNACSRQGSLPPAASTTLVAA